MKKLTIKLLSNSIVKWIASNVMKSILVLFVGGISTWIMATSTSIGKSVISWTKSVINIQRDNNFIDSEIDNVNRRIDTIMYNDSEFRRKTYEAFSDIKEIQKQTNKSIKILEIAISSDNKQIKDKIDELRRYQEIFSFADTVKKNDYMIYNYR